MSTRQRLRRYLDLQAATGVCWRCNLKRQQRYFSTVQDSQTGLTLEAETRMQTHLSIFGVAREGAVPPRKRDTLAESAVPVCKIGPEPELVLRKDSDGSGHGNSSLPSNIEERARPPLQTWKHHDSESPLEPGTHSAVALSTTRRCAKLSAHPLLESVQTTRMMMSESGSLRAMLLRRSAKLTGRPWLDSVQITRIKMNLPGSLSAVELIRRRRLAKLSRRPWLESVQITRMKISKQAQFDRALIASRKQAEAHISDAVPASPPPLSDALQSKPSLSLDSMRTSPLHQILPHFGERTLSKSRVGVDFFRLQKRTYISSSFLQAAAEAHISIDVPEPLPDITPSQQAPRNIRERLRIWQMQQDQLGEPQPEGFGFHDVGKPGTLQNLITRRQEGDRIIEAEEVEDEVDNAASPVSDVDDGIPDLRDTRQFLRPGDLVELGFAKRPILAIYIRNLEDQAQFYTMEGKWVHRVARYVYFFVPRYVHPTSLAQIIPYLPQTRVAKDKLDILQSMDLGVPREAGADVVKKMLMFLKESNDAYRKYADKIDNAHEVMADERDIFYATATEIAMKVLQISNSSKISPPMLWAVHRACMQDDLGFSADYRKHRITNSFEIRPEREISLVKQVRAWLREYQEATISQKTTDTALASDSQASTATSTGAIKNPVAGFVEKSRGLIINSRKMRSITHCGGIGPSSTKVEMVAPYQEVTKNVPLALFSIEEQDILRFVEFWAARRAYSTVSTLSSVGSTLLRAIGMYEGFELDCATGYVLLQELGYIAPWENRVVFDTRLGLPRHHLDAVTEELHSLATRSHVHRPDWVDKMAGLRKDWGDLEVFCIDGAGAMEIDDGFSLEEVEDEPSKYWVHVHIANPTAFIPPDHPAAMYAAHLAETVYFPEMSYYMLGPGLKNSHFSLAKGRPSLTFSAKMNMDGDILDMKITPGRIHNVSFFTPSETLKALAPDEVDSDRRTVLTVGGIMPSATRKDVASGPTEAQTLVLRKLQQLGAARRRKRAGAGAVTVDVPRPEVAVYLQASRSDLIYPWRRRARIIEGDPIISMEARMFNPIPKANASGAAYLVPDIMILAGEIAATWCRQRNIPVIYRGNQSNPELPSHEKYRNEVLHPATTQYGYPPFLLILIYLRLVGRGVASINPIKHRILALDAYTKATSPLRRYGDMLAHWQIEAALRHEARTGHQFNGRNKKHAVVLPFSRSRVAKILPHITERERMILLAKNSSQRHWIIQLIFRAYYFKEAELPDTFQMFISNVLGITVGGGGEWAGFVMEWGMDANMVVEGGKGGLGSMGGEVDPGDYWEVKIKSVDVYLRRLIMEPVRLLKKGTEAERGGKMERERER